MERLGEAYDRSATARDPRRVAAGEVLGGLGALAVAAAVVAVAVAGESFAARHAAGVSAGLGVPAMLLAVVVVLPASLRARIAVVGGSLLAVVGVGLFWRAYPDDWLGAGGLMFEATAVYALGCALALAAVFAALARFRRRNSPAGTVTLEVTRQGGTETVEVSREQYRRVQEAVSDGGADATAVVEDLLEE